MQLHTERVALKLKHWSLNLLAGPLIMIYINTMVLIFHTYIGLKTIFLQFNCTIWGKSHNSSKNHTIQVPNFIKQFPKVKLTLKFWGDLPLHKLHMTPTIFNYYGRLFTVFFFFIRSSRSRAYATLLPERCVTTLKTAV